MTMHPQPTITPFFDPEKEKRPMNVVAFMSGSGTNVEKILEYQMALQEKHGQIPYQVVAIFSDTTLRKSEKDKGSKAQIIADEWNKEYGDNIECLFWCDIDKWYQQEGRYDDKRAIGETRETKLKLRTMYDQGTVNEVLDPLKEKVGHIDLIAAAGYMSFLTAPVLNYATGVNVHPADLTILGEDGKRKYRGDHAVRDAILAGEKTISASTHYLGPEVDMGDLFMVSAPLEVILSSPEDGVNVDNLSLEELRENPKVAEQVEDFNQDRLKEAGDWIIFPKTLEYIATGRFGTCPDGNVYHKNDKGIWIPGEIRLGK